MTQEENTDDNKKRLGRMSGSERVAKHRKKKREIELQIAVAAARLAVGRDAGDQRLALRDFLQQFTKQDDLPEDYIQLFDAAVDILSRKRSRY